MYFINKIKEITNNKKAIMYVDMDGVITDYEVGMPLDFKNKRPLNQNINTIKEINNLDNIELHILSICRKNYQIKEKNDWLDKYASFFKKENRTIISKENYLGIESKYLKVNYLKEVVEETDDLIIMLDDDNEVLKQINKDVPKVILFQDSSLID